MKKSETSTPFSLKGKTVLVTGASSGIGRATAILAARLGAKLLITGRDAGRLETTRKQLAGKGHRAVVADLAAAGAVDRLAAEAPVLDGLVNNAGFNNRRPIGLIRPADTEGLFAVDAFAPIQLVSALVKARKLAQGGSVVFTTSLAGRGTPSVGNGLYAAAKASLAAFARTAALELAAKGIRSNSVAPGVVETPFLAADRMVSAAQWEAERRAHPLRRFGSPGDVANAIVFLLSDAAAWITGTELVVDGGRSLV